MVRILYTYHTREYMIPNNITKQHVLKALKKIDDEGTLTERQFGKDRLIYKEKAYPPEYVISVAAHFASDQYLVVSEFNHIEANAFLKNLKFNIFDFFTKGDIEGSLKRIEDLLSCGIFHPNNSNHVLMRAAFIEMLISLRDLMYKSEKYASRINFTDDIVIEDKIKDVSDLIKYVRDALCHPDSNNHYIEKNNIKSTFNIAFGKCNLLKIGDFEQKSEYADDICFFFGSKKIYLNRHIIRAYKEAKEKIEPILNNNYKI